MKNKSIIIIISTILVLTIAGVGFWLWNKSQETVIDLGNGWSSYSNRKIGISVKIPSDVEIKKELDDESFTYSVNFSKGPVRSVGNITTLKYGGEIKEKNYDEKVQYFRDEMTEENNKWSEIAKTTKTRTRYFSREIKIDNKSVFLYFQEAENLRRKENNFNINSVLIPGEKGFYTMWLNKEEIESLYPEIQNTQSNEEYMDKIEKIVLDLIISVDEKDIHPIVFFEIFLYL